GLNNWLSEISLGCCAMNDLKHWIREKFAGLEDASDAADRNCLIAEAELFDHSARRDAKLASRIGQYLDRRLVTGKSGLDNQFCKSGDSHVVYLRRIDRDYEIFGT